MKACLVLLVLILLRLTDCSAQDSAFRRIDKLFEVYDHTNTPGLALMIIDHGKVIYQRGYGMADLEHQVPISLQTVFEIGSFSKQFTAFCALLLADRGVISLDDDVRKFIPELHDYGHPIKIIHLITHTSGLRDVWTLFYLAGLGLENYYPSAMIFDMINRQKKLNFNPGDEFMYSNTGYFLLTEIIQRASHESLRRFAEENLFGPLGMRHTHYQDDYTELVGDRAFGYDKSDSGYRWNISFNTSVGAGRLYTTVEDLFLWDQHFYKNPLGSGQALVKEETTPFVLNDGKPTNYGFGLFVERYQGMKIQEHNGAWAGYRSEILRFPDQEFSVICLSNRSDFRSAEEARSVAAVFLPLQSSAASESIPASPKTLARAPIKNSDLAKMAGSYHSPELDVVYRLSAQDSLLRVQPGYGHALLLTPETNDRFVKDSMVITLIRSSRGQITGFLLDEARVKGIEFFRK
jgi:CubicO group peptidase (beta-lactamase class C family)